MSQTTTMGMPTIPPEIVKSTQLRRVALRSLLDQAAEGRRFIVTWNGRPMAMIGPIEGTSLDPTDDLLRRAASQIPEKSRGN